MERDADRITSIMRRTLRLLHFDLNSACNVMCGSEFLRSTDLLFYGNYSVLTVQEIWTFSLSKIYLSGSVCQLPYSYAFQSSTVDS